MALLDELLPALRDLASGGDAQLVADVQQLEGIVSRRAASAAAAVDQAETEAKSWLADRLKGVLPAPSAAVSEPAPESPDQVTETS